MSDTSSAPAYPRLTLDEYKALLSRLREHLPKLCMFANWDVDNPVLDEDGLVVTPDLVPTTEFGPGLSVSELLNVCGCGDNDELAEVVLEMLQWCTRFGPSGPNENDRPGRFWGTATPAQRALLYWFDQMDLTDHGSSVFMSYLTEKGELVEDLLVLWRRAKKHFESTNQPKENEDEEHGAGSTGDSVGD